MWDRLKVHRHLEFQRVRRDWCTDANVVVCVALVIDCRWLYWLVIIAQFPVRVCVRRDEHCRKRHHFHYRFAWRIKESALSRHSYLCVELEFHQVVCAKVIDEKVTYEFYALSCSRLKEKSHPDVVACSVETLHSHKKRREHIAWLKAFFKNRGFIKSDPKIREKLVF